jgi:asparagine synthase (glutamine-hydrolysing)
MSYRGPDDQGVEIGGRGGLGFVRLSIIDIEGGHQPMRSPCGRYTLVFNGEIYNFRELRSRLEEQGRRFRTHSDSEVLLAMYERYGTKMLDELNGMFAFMIHDADDDSLFGARDRLGIKPLYYACTESTFVFASELPALRASGLVSTEIDPEAFAQYLTHGFTVGSRTIHQSARALPPGFCIRVVGTDVDVNQYWRVENTTSGPSTLPEAADAAETILKDAVGLRRVADVPLGALLSGGIDSGLVTAFLSMSQSDPVKTFSVGFEEQGFNELPWARRVAEMYGTEHVEILCRPDVLKLVQRLATAYGEPFGDSSAIPTYLVCEEARRHVTVALSGDGGDEVFAGYRRHTQFMGRASLPGRPLLALAYGLGSRFLPVMTPGLRRLRRASQGARGSQVASVVLLDAVTRRWLGGERLQAALRRFDPEEAAARAGGDFDEQAGLARFQHQDLTVFLPDDILTKVDRASMLNSLELRVPFLDHRLVALGLNLPDDAKNDGERGKLVLRELARRHLPETHLAKPKTGFSMPVAGWLRGELRELVRDCLEHCNLARDGWLNQHAVDRIVSEHMSGRSVASAVWLLMIAELWYRDQLGENHGA